LTLTIHRIANVCALGGELIVEQQMSRTTKDRHHIYVILKRLISQQISKKLLTFVEKPECSLRQSTKENKSLKIDEIFIVLE
jgi:hypothetical protein